MVIVDREIILDRSLELPRAAVHSTADLFLREQGKPALDQVEPRSTRGSEVQMEAGPLRKFGSGTGKRRPAPRGVMKQSVSPKTPQSPSQSGKFWLTLAAAPITVKVRPRYALAKTGKNENQRAQRRRRW